VATFILSSAGVQVPSIVYGTAWKKADTAPLVSLALRMGFRGIDTACQPKHYNEPGVGDGIAAWLTGGHSRSDLYLQTKFTSLSGQDAARVPYDPHAPLADQVAQSFAASLRNLKTDYLDCLVLHSPMPTGEETLLVWRAIEAIIDTGGIRQAGISNCYTLSTLRDLHRAARHKPAVVQNRFYAQTGYDRDIRAFCVDNGLVYQSFWTLSANPEVLAHARVAALAAAHRKTAAQVLFRFLTQSAVVPLTGTRSEAHMREDLAIFDFGLTPTECATIEAILANQGRT
jgi:diketogulonate reductase-like aldo/keto reductase